MNRIIAGGLAAFLALVGPARAGDSPVVVELFTSQGCSSCPPVDALIAELAKRDDVIPLALHVDYWDYIGWKDIFADPAHTMRQKAYAQVAGARSIYTPQLVVGGTDHIVGYRPMDLARVIESHAESDSPVSLSMTRDGKNVVITAQSEQRFDEDVVLQVVRYRPEASVEIKRGENSGRVLHYANIVEAWKAVARWDGAEPLIVTVETVEGKPVVAIVQRPGPGPIIAAAQLR
ncbi:DUF1223 domain-containing protein [Rhodovulum adriaticum]|uniref:Secreted protein n=1 Tax=Rhodovulum adriaticum TaxID=35804 RepID=A0A4R2NTW9_RHOAD|nr:DUF1223 domain-containing protein [Rhodovulum adriaticum]MBK1636189.1 DUF1223 domain-containing protein [Rhodovulum adriaticum]TCP25509.1 hypothetical protein EV656_103262 [Rhodovulum adriaticum]